jgi:hypothetical protein
LTASGADGIDQQVKVYYGWGSDAGDGTIPSMNSYYDMNSMRSWSGWSGGSFGVFMGTSQTNALEFTYGQPFDFWLHIAVQTEIVGSEPGDVSAVFSLSNWSGFKGLPDGMAISSGSGADWTKPVANHFARPPVSMTPLGGSVRIVWPTNNIGGFVLEYTTGFSPFQWLISTETATAEASQNVVNLEILTGNRFYRLRRPTAASSNVLSPRP